MAWWGKLLTSINRKKTLDDDMMETPLRRCLSTVDLTLWGIGHMVGAGIYVITGTVTRDIAGPAVILSYLLAGFAAALASLCYAEFGARVPKAGSAYTYTYVTMGEFWAFLIGWNIILEHTLAGATVARAWSASLDALFNNAISNGTIAYIGRLNSPWLGEYPDFVALAIILIMMVFVAYGAKTSANLNNLFTVFNIVVISLIIMVGLYNSDIDNWTNKQSGGFMPYGFSGVISGAATCFFAYLGFEGIAIAGEEVKNPAKSIPIATFIAMIVVTVLYVTSSAALTLMVPWYTVDVAAPFPKAFAYHNMLWMKIAIAFGSLFGISTSLLGSVFSLPRAVYSMASDGLFFRSLAKINSRTQTPIYSIITFGTLAGILTLLVGIETLVEFLSIGTLCSFTIVAAGVLVLRYQPVDKCQFELRPETPSSMHDDDDKQQLISSQSHDDIGKLKSAYENLPILRDIDPSNLTRLAIIINVLSIILFAILLVLGFEYIANGTWWAVILLIVFGVVIALSVVLLLLHEQNVSFLTYQMPLVPVLPCLSMFLNVCLMLKLNPLTWIRMAVWLSLGLLVYFLYGMHHSTENRPLAAAGPGGQVISYAGTQGPSGAINTGPFTGSETIHTQQPRGEIASDSESDGYSATAKNEAFFSQ